MNRCGNCWDNAAAKSFFSLESERVRKRVYKTRELARAETFGYIEVLYNRTRRHSHLGGVSPEAFERAPPCGQNTPTIPWGAHSQVTPGPETQGSSEPYMAPKSIHALDDDDAGMRLGLEIVANHRVNIHSPDQPPASDAAADHHDVAVNVYCTTRSQMAIWCSPENRPERDLHFDSLIVPDLVLPFPWAPWRF
jgi:hypothetical protein